MSIRDTQNSQLFEIGNFWRQFLEWVRINNENFKILLDWSLFEEEIWNLANLIMDQSQFFNIHQIAELFWEFFQQIWWKIKLLKFNKGFELLGACISSHPFLTYEMRYSISTQINNHKRL